MERLAAAAMQHSQLLLFVEYIIQLYMILLFHRASVYVYKSIKYYILPFQKNCPPQLSTLIKFELKLLILLLLTSMRVLKEIDK
jgi:hypothetical protein